MKAKIISTGEILKVGYITMLRDDDSLYNASVHDIEIIDDSTDKAIDWEQRRYEIAKDALAGIISEESIPGTDPFHYIDKDVSRAIEYADELIKQLKSKQ